MTDSTEIREASLAEIALLFLKLGTTAFGGPAAHLAMMEEEFVRRRHWITHAEFLDRLATANLIPGPSSTEVAIFIGQLKRGWRGLIVAGCCFIIPAAAIVSVIAWAYVRFGSLPRVEGVLSAIKPAVVAIVIQALGKLGRTGIRTALLAVIAVLAAGLSLLGVSPVLVLVFAGLVSAAALAMKNRLLGAIGFPKIFGLQKLIGLPKVVAGAMIVAAGSAAFPVGLMRLFLSFLKIGSVVFGSGYVLLAFLQTEFVERLHWLTEKQLIDAVAVGQFTPGPVFTTATFIGYIVAGWAGALIATVGIFLPGFVLVAVSGPLIPRLRKSAAAAAALDGVVAGSLALMAVVAWQLGKASIADRPTLLVFAVSLIALLRFRMNSAWLIVAAAIVGWFMQ
ncbi:MAG TPA: chromate efflux transporter [Terriglobales bacterium]|nr:chromate efflux transporter [Terriglobales bacterium]